MSSHMFLHLVHFMLEQIIQFKWEIVIVVSKALGMLKLRKSGWELLVFGFRSRSKC